MNKPKILFYDIETEPNTAYVWGKYQQDVIAYKKERSILCFAYSWLNGPTTCHTREGLKTDKALCIRLYRLFNEADIVVAHNGDDFDQKVVRARMLYHGVKPHKILTTIDTKKVAKAYFNFNSNSLKDLAKYLKLPNKLENTPFEVWLGCMKDDPKSWARMVRYNKRDIKVLKAMYRKFLPWINNHPNIARLLHPKEAYGKKCPTCASSNITKKGVRANTRTVQQQWVCECGRWFLTSIKAVK